MTLDSFLMVSLLDSGEFTKCKGMSVIFRITGPAAMA